MRGFSATDTIGALSDQAGVDYEWNGAVVTNGVPAFGSIAGTGATLPTGAAASIWTALGGSLSAVARLTCFNTGSTDANIKIYLNGTSVQIAAFIVRAGGTSIWNGGNIHRYDNFGGVN